MKFLKYFVLLLLVLIIIGAIYVAVQPSEFKVERTRTIKAPATVIYNNVIDFKNWEAWSSWAEADSEMKITLPDQTKGVGGSYSWEDKDGIGIMKTINATPNSSISQTMQFGDFPASDIKWNFAPTQDGATEVTWNISGKDLPFMFKAFSAFTGGMEKQIGPHYERSLEKLDSIVVNSMKKRTVTVNGLTEYGGGFYLYKTTSANASNISATMAKQYGEISAFMAQNNIQFFGMPFTIYLDMNAGGNGEVIMSNAIPVKEKIIVTGDNNIICGFMPKMKVLKTTLKGNYIYLSEAWSEAQKYMAANNLQPAEANPFEIYTNDPGDFPNPADWITEIYIPVKE